MADAQKIVDRLATRIAQLEVELAIAYAQITEQTEDVNTEENEDG